MFLDIFEKKIDSKPDYLIMLEASQTWERKVFKNFEEPKITAYFKKSKTFALVW